MTRKKSSFSNPDNTEVRKFLMSTLEIYDQESYSMLIPSWIDDCIRGGICRMHMTKPPTTYRVYTYLTYLDKINNTTVGEIMNRKKLALDGTTYSEKYIAKWVGVIKNASQAIKHHMKMYPDKYTSLT